MLVFFRSAIVATTLATLALSSIAQTTQEGATNMSSAASLNGNWIVTEAAGVTIRDRKMRFEFSDGSVFGRAPCNSFRAQVITTDGQFSLGMLELRGNVCDADVMDDEREYLRILDRLSHFEIDAEGALVLSSFGTSMIRAVPET